MATASPVVASTIGRKAMAEASEPTASAAMAPSSQWLERNSRTRSRKSRTRVTNAAG